VFLVFRISKKTLAVSTAALVMAGGVAYAFSTYATGTTNNTTVATAQPVVLTNDPIENLWPGAPAVDIPVTYENSNPGPIVVNAAVSVKSVAPAECPIASFIIDPNLPPDVTVPVGTDVWPADLPQIALDVNAPDSCQGATVELEYGPVTPIVPTPTPPVS
jgi:hypothetical protein